MYHAFVLLVLTAQLTAAAPPPKAVTGVTDLYFPTKLGAQRVYAATAGKNTTEERSTVTGVVEKDGVWRVTEVDDGISSNPLGSDTTYLVSGSGVTLVARGGKDVTAPHQCLVLPAKVGDTWVFDPEGPNRAFAIPNLSITYTARKEETIEVPAGTFQAIPVDSSRAVGPPFTGTTWYAPGLGVVKAVTNFGGRERTTVLKSFSPGR